MSDIDGLFTIKDSLVQNVTTYNTVSDANALTNISQLEQLEPWCLDLQSSDLLYSADYHTTPLRYVVGAVFLTFLIFTVIGNSIVIVVVVIDRRLRRITSGLIISMAAADILVGLSVELHGVIRLFQPTSGIHVSDQICELSISADIYFSLCELLHLVCLALERYLVICHPFKYQRCGKKFLIFIIVMAWTVPFIFSFLPMLLFWHRVGHEDIYSCLDSLEIDLCVFYPNKIFSSVLVVVMFVLPTFLLFFCYTRILRVALNHQRKIGTQTNLRVYYESQDAVYFQSVHDQQKTGSPSHLKHPEISVEDISDEKNVINFDHKTRNNHIQLEGTPFLITAETNKNSLTKSNHQSTEHISNSTKKENTLEKFKLSKKTNLGGAKSKCDVCRALCGIYDFRASRSIVYVCFCFIITWTPYWTILFISPFIGPLNLPKEGVLVSFWLFALGTAINPFVYYFSNTNVRRGMLRVGKKLFKFSRCNNTE